MSLNLRCQSLFLGVTHCTSSRKEAFQNCTLRTTCLSSRLVRDHLEVQRADRINPKQHPKLNSFQTALKPPKISKNQPPPCENPNFARPVCVRQRPALPASPPAAKVKHRRSASSRPHPLRKCFRASCSRCLKKKAVSPSWCKDSDKTWPKHRSRPKL